MLDERRAERGRLEKVVDGGPIIGSMKGGQVLGVDHHRVEVDGVIRNGFVVPLVCSGRTITNVLLKATTVTIAGAAKNQGE